MDGYSSHASAVSDDQKVGFGRRRGAGEGGGVSALVAERQVVEERVVRKESEPNRSDSSVNAEWQGGTAQEYFKKLSGERLEGTSADGSAKKPFKVGRTEEEREKKSESMVNEIEEEEAVQAGGNEWHGMLRLGQ